MPEQLDDPADAVRRMMEDLAEPFDPKELDWKPQSVAKDGNRALAICYIDARAVMDRLDRVVGPDNWEDEYALQPDGNVECRLSIRLAGRKVTKADVGGESDQKDSGDKRKAAYSDALKRAAVKWGIGRYLYSLGGTWMDYDQQKKQLKGTPALPDWALPRKRPAPEKPAPKKGADAPPAKPGAPADGAELHRRLTDYDAKLAKEGLCQLGDLFRLVAVAGVTRGYPPGLANWDSPEQIQFAAEEVKAIEARWRTPPKEAAKPAPAQTPHGKITPEQVRKLQALADEADVFWPDVAAKVGRDKAGRPKERVEDLTPAEWLVAMDLLSSRRPEAATA